LENYRLLQERQPEIGGALSCQRMLAFLLRITLLACIAGRVAYSLFQNCAGPATCFPKQLLCFTRRVVLRAPRMSF